MLNYFSVWNGTNKFDAQNDRVNNLKYILSAREEYEYKVLSNLTLNIEIYTSQSRDNHIFERR